MAKIKFHVSSPGDQSVGIFPLTGEVCIDDNMVWDKSMIDEFKKALAEMYDTDLGHVGTEREYLEMVRKGDIQEMQFHQSEIDSGYPDFHSLQMRVKACKENIERVEKKLADPNLL